VTGGTIAMAYFVSKNNVPIIIDGRKYESATAAANALGVTLSSLRVFHKKFLQSLRKEMEIELVIKKKFVLTKGKDEII